MMVLILRELQSLDLCSGMFLIDNGKKKKKKMWQFCNVVISLTALGCLYGSASQEVDCNQSVRHRLTLNID